MKIVEKVEKDGEGKDGDKFLKLTFEIDESKPMVFREGSSYRFNSRLVKEERLSKHEGW